MNINNVEKLQEVEGLEALANGPRLRELDAHVPVSTFMRALRLSRDEVYHSRLLAFLLDGRRSTVADPLAREILAFAAKGVDGSPPALSSELMALSAVPSTSVRAKEEKWNIDIVAEIDGAPGRAVLAIENKIDAGEGIRQVERYQEILWKEFPERANVLLFLTPTGIDARTANESSPVPCIPMSYDDLFTCLTNAAQSEAASDQVCSIALNFAEHIKEEIVGSNHVRSLVQDLWRAHPQAMRLALKYRPRLEDIKHEYVEALLRNVGEELNIRYYPEKRSALREIKMTPKRWDDGGMH